MTKVQVAESTKELAQYLCCSTKEVWENHTDEAIKKEFTFEEINSLIANVPGKDG